MLDSANTTDGRPLLTLSGASKWLNARSVGPRSVSAMYVLIARGEIHARELMPRVWAVEVTDLEAYAERQRAANKNKAATSV